MLRYVLNEADVAAVRFGISPLCELGLSLRAIRDPSRYPLQLPWLARTERARSGLDLAALTALVDERLWTPDFLNPRPESPLTRIEDELDALSGLSAAEFRRDLVAVHGHVPAAFAGPARAAVRRLVRALRELWDATFEPHWPRMRAVLEADVVHRGRQIAQSGLSAMLNGISSTVDYADGVVSVRLRDPTDRTQRIGGSGLTLVPTMFTRRGSAPVGDGPPMIMYPARGQGALWETERVANPDAVAAVLGQPRARLLAALGEPASSTELGVRFDVTTSAVNQHLRVLRDAGLVTSTRYGRSVLYLRSELGSRLLSPFG
ncbi:ArsR/SmtB family transcription factor [Microbacterium ulmi]|uniref:Helix-turn-helix transcriptional regulator n=1 Tax=Microbacterium ulmi TaxID=179095 RepID=A0A7Y2M0V8_9MICO|nr:DUF5937 family protein [Microbacterium ulmi]NII69204.1 DNA-binding transcriptional ArsR family regulator [Microbacterium ulmi]NNH03744.1 helix-turn-helix transcriptional regulator [Microbacterium ulmi]